MYIKSIEDILAEPVVQLVILVTLSVLSYDLHKFILYWFWKKIGGDDEEGW